MRKARFLSVLYQLVIFVQLPLRQMKATCNLISNVLSLWKGRALGYPNGAPHFGKLSRVALKEVGSGACPQSSSGVPVLDGYEISYEGPGPPYWEYLGHPIGSI